MFADSFQLMNSHRTKHLCQSFDYWLWDSLKVTAVPGELFLSFPLYELLFFESLALSLRSDFSCPLIRSGKNYWITAIFITAVNFTIMNSSIFHVHL